MQGGFETRHAIPELNIGQISRVMLGLRPGVCKKLQSCSYVPICRPQKITKHEGIADVESDNSSGMLGAAGCHAMSSRLTKI